ncbi:MAG: KpsF/GutQ family sugar-phosphate isomerase [Ferruginibacter sp.]
MNNKSIIVTAQNTIELEASAIRNLVNFIDGDFANAISKIAASTGRLVVSGIGKSAIIAQKIVATLNSTGTPALFMHAADAVHGDLGMIQKEDVIIIISKSGDSPEIKVLAPLIKSFGNTLIGIVGNTSSFLAKQCDIVLNTTVSQEACPNNLAPTTSTTAQMVMGDALAVCLMQVKGFGTADFARFHPGGMLGKKLYLRVADLSAQNEQPSVTGDATINQVIVEITRRRLGATAVVNGDKSIAGIITDGDLRRMLEKTTNFSALQANDIMSINPAIIDASVLAAEALEMMKARDISQLLVIENGLYAGIIHLHDLVKEGII